WCKEKKIQTPIEQMTVGHLDVNFRRFYAEARNKAGEPYSKSTLLGFRHSFEIGREGQRELKRSSFKFEADASGRKFVTIAHDEATKNHPGGLSDVSSHENLARMYETP
ncbi:unnamed protein product, partial [Porites evermanni]